CGAETVEASAGWVALALPFAGPRTRNEELGAARDQRHSPEALVEYLRTTLHKPAAWNQRGLRRAVKCWAPNGAPAHIGRQAKKHRVREFIGLWDAGANRVRMRWGTRAAESRSHVTLGDTAVHIPGLYLRWGNP
ncbi:MAG TPA: hypothetical protein DFR83_11165, partial [Deltaproteobacteria bacterium]|nr:hypothetical protein [Deltaproteobacteria bacterium]